ncbi:MAG: hypothetical protein ACYCOU_24515 [Sulfobacillus sp.]
MNDSQERETVRRLMLQAWDNVGTFHAVARAQYYNVGEDAGPERHPPWNFLDSTALFAFNRREPWILSAWWKTPDTWRYFESSPVAAREEYLAQADHWAYRINGVEKAKGSRTSSKLPLFIVGSPIWSPQDNCRRWWWMNPQLWVESMRLEVLEKGLIQGHDLYHVIAYQDPEALRWNRGLFDQEQDLEIIFAGHVYQLWIDPMTGFFHRLTAEADNGRAWDVIVDTLVLNQPIEEDVFG